MPDHDPSNEKHARIRLEQASLPPTFFGIGAPLVPVSKQRNVDEHVQYDAVETFVFLFLPLIPYKAVHVLSTWSEGIGGKRYRSVPLRFSLRFAAKAFLSGWGDGFIIVGGVLGVVGAFAIALVEEEFGKGGVIFWGVAISVLLIGLVLKSLYVAMNRTDERIKDIIGPHGLGTSDPYRWSKATIESMADAIRDPQDQRPLVDLAEESFRENDTATAMYITRIGMRAEPSPRFQELHDRLMSEALSDPSASA